MYILSGSVSCEYSTMHGPPEQICTWKCMFYSRDRVLCLQHALQLSGLSPRCPLRCRVQASLHVQLYCVPYRLKTLLAVLSLERPYAVQLKGQEVLPSFSDLMGIFMRLGATSLLMPWTRRKWRGPCAAATGCAT